MKQLTRHIQPDIPQLKEMIHQQAFHTGTGIIKYDPPRGQMKAKTNWWAVMECDNQITDYYRAQVEKQYGLKLHQPSWGAHVSIIRGEKPREDLMHLWKKYHNKKVQFKYSHFPRFNGDTKIVTKHKSGAFWFLDVDAPFLTDIRKELQLPYDWKLHMTLGRRWD